MRITYLHQYFNTPDMSGGTRSFEMARRLVLAGHEVNMVTSWRTVGARLQPFFTRESGINVHWLPVKYSNHMSYGQRLTAFLKFAFAAAKQVSGIPADVVLATSTPLTIALPGVYAARKHRVPMVFEVRDLWPELPIAMGALRNPLLRDAARWLEGWAYRNSSAIVALSPGMRDGIIRTGYPQDQVALIPNACDNEMLMEDRGSGIAFRRKREWLGNRPLLVYAGALGLINGVGYLVDIASCLARVDPDVRILVVGDGVDASAIRDKALRVGVLGRNFFMEPAVPKKSVPTLLCAADMCCSLFVDLPEMRSNSANKFFDALAAGKPLLVNYGGWHRDIIGSSGAGLATWGMSASEVAERLANVIRDREWLYSAGKSARRLAETRFDRSQLAQLLEGVLCAAVQGRGADCAEITAGV